MMYIMQVWLRLSVFVCGSGVYNCVCVCVWVGCLCAFAGESTALPLASLWEDHQRRGAVHQRLQLQQDVQPPVSHTA